MTGEDAAEFAELYDPLRRFAAIVRAPDVDPDDLVQAALERTLAMHRLDELDEPAAYLRTVILRLASAERRGGDSGSHPSALTDIWSLEPVDRAALFLSLVEHRTHREIADALMCTEDVSRQRVSLALTLLGVEVAEAGDV